MADDGLDSELFAISLLDSEPEEGTSASAPADGTANGTRADRTALSEEDFQKLKSTYRPKVQNGEIWSTTTLPVSTSGSKPEAQELLHAVEELYFFRRYHEAIQFLQRLFSEEGKGGYRLDEEVQKLLRYYESRCCARLGRAQTEPRSQIADIPAGIVNSA